MIRWLTRPSRFPRRPRIIAAFVLSALAFALWLQTSPAGGASNGDKAPNHGQVKALPASASAQEREGQQLFDERCASCHGLNLRGRSGIAPSLVGVGAGPVDFYVSTGRMPLANPKAEPVRSTPDFTRSQTKALVAYVRARAGGPKAPNAYPASGSLALGFKLFDENCAGCHSIVARGGITVGGQVPDLQQATPRQVAEAVRTGPYLMPHFDSHQLNQHDLNSLAKYVLWTRKPDNPGGWGIYNIGPIPEGIVAWFVGLLALVIIARLIGERIE